MSTDLVPYDLIFEQKGAITLTIFPNQQQLTGGSTDIRHYLPVGTYMLHVTYDGAEKLDLRKNKSITIGTIPAGVKGQVRTLSIPRHVATTVSESIYLVSTPSGASADSTAKATITVFPMEQYNPQKAGGG